MPIAKFDLLSSSVTSANTKGPERGTHLTSNGTRIFCTQRRLMSLGLQGCQLSTRYIYVDHV